METDSGSEQTGSLQSEMETAILAGDAWTSTLTSASAPDVNPGGTSGIVEG
jgi:hypothetical protein